MNILMGSHFSRFSNFTNIQCHRQKTKNVGPDGLAFQFVQRSLLTRQEILTITWTKQSNNPSPVRKFSVIPLQRIHAHLLGSGEDKPHLLVILRTAFTG